MAGKRKAGGRKGDTIGGVSIGKLSGFTPQVVRNDYSVKEQRQLYSQLRHVAVERLKRLEASGLPSTLTTQYGGVFLQSAFIQDADLPFMLTELRYFLTASTSTVAGLRAQVERTVATLQDVGISVSKKNLGEFAQFMQAFRSAHIDKKLYKSDQAAMLWDSIQSKNISWRQVVRNGFQDFLDHAEELKNVVLPEGTRRSAANYRKALKKG